jgi:glycosyltransferase involved in cell wall biosynthesis
VPPRVSVIIATYNWSNVLPYSIGSVLRQTMTDFEVLVVGDGCTDDSAEVVANIGDPRVRWINLPVNSGHQSTPNNTGLRAARGEYIAYLGHDDLWLPHHLASHLDAIGEAGATVGYSVVALVAPDGSIAPALPWPRYGTWSPPSAMTHRRTMTESIGEWRDYRELTVAPEIDLFRRAASDGSTFAFVPRLTAIKFPASVRRDVYRHRPSHEQAQWTARIASEPNLEATLLARMLVAGGECARMPYRELLRQATRETMLRARRRIETGAEFTTFFRRRKGGAVDAVRAFKGVKEL